MKRVLDTNLGQNTSLIKHDGANAKTSFKNVLQIRSYTQCMFQAFMIFSGFLKSDFPCLLTLNM